MTGAATACPLCAEAGGELLHRGEHFRIVLADEPDYPGFCRVIWNAHAAEMSDLSSERRSLMMSAVWLVEAALREVMAPDKINLASLGNVVPHLHWHVIPRYRNDRHFPAPVWAQAARDADPASLEARRAKLAKLKEAIVAGAAKLD